MSQISNYIRFFSDHVSQTISKETHNFVNYFNHKISKMGLLNDLKEIRTLFLTTKNLDKSLEKSSDAELDIIILKGRLDHVSQSKEIKGGILGKITSIFLKDIKNILNKKELEINKTKITQLREKLNQIKGDKARVKTESKNQFDQNKLKQNELASELNVLDKQLNETAAQLGNTHHEISLNSDKLLEADEDHKATYVKLGHMQNHPQEHAEVDIQNQINLEKTKLAEYHKYKKMDEDLNQKKNTLQSKVEELRAQIDNKMKAFEQKTQDLEKIKEKFREANLKFDNEMGNIEKEIKVYLDSNISILTEPPSEPPKTSK